MKRINNLYDVIDDIEVIMDMYDNVVSKSTKNKKKVMQFDDYYSCNIGCIKRIIHSNNYIPGRYNIFLIREPKLRIIMSQSVQDKIINHIISKYFLVYGFDRCLIKENCATRVGMGTHYALKLFKKYINDCNRKYEKFYVLKIDISKYFYNIDHGIVKQLVRNRIKDKKVLKMIDSVIDSTDCNYVNETINLLKEKEIARLNELNTTDKYLKIKEVESLPLYNNGKGFPIGNMTSQIIATFYLNELDHYIKETLGVKYYVRYMDDAVLFHEDKEFLKESLVKIEKIIQRYRLTLNRKTKIYSSNEEIEFLGFRFLMKNKIILKLSNKTKKRFKKKMRKIYTLYNSHSISFDKFRSVKDSYLGHLSYGSCNKLIYYNISNRVCSDDNL